MLPNKQEVIKALECCAEKGMGKCPIGCPYWGFGDEGCEILSDAAALLKHASILDDGRFKVPLNPLLRGTEYDWEWVLEHDPTRVLSLEEALEKALEKRGPLWMESREGRFLRAKFTDMDDGQRVMAECKRCMATLYTFDYGEQWRVWNRMPTDEQRKAAKWVV